MSSKIEKGFLLFVLLLGMAEASPGLEKFKFATAVKIYPPYYLPILAGEEKGFFKQQGLEPEWIPFRGADAMFPSVVAKSLAIGMSPTINCLTTAARGGPVVIISSLVPGVGGWAIWIRTDSPIKGAKDLKGVRLGVSGLGAVGHVLGQAAIKKLGLEGQIKWVGVGGVATMAAALKAGAVGGVVTGPAAMLALKAQGEAREAVLITDYLPKEWVDHVLFARRDFIEEKGGLTGKVVKAVIQGTGHALDNRTWSLEKMKAFSGYSDRVAELWYDIVKGMSRDGKIDRRAIQNMLDFLTSYGLIKKGEAPSAEELFTNRFLG